MSEVSPVVDVRSLCKDYAVVRSLGRWLRHPSAGSERVRALEDVSFSIKAGRIVGVMGLNGAGKTTLLKLLCNLLVPTSGEVYVAGCCLRTQDIQARQRIGFVPSDERSFFWRISARANLEFFAALYHVPPRRAARRIDALLENFGLGKLAGGHFRDYSSGMRKRLAIIRGLLHEPDVLVLDEPTNSLDAHWDQYLRDYTRAWVCDAPGRVVVWSTHRTEEAEEVCDSIIHLQRGQVVLHLAAAENRRAADLRGAACDVVGEHRL